MPASPAAITRFKFIRLAIGSPRFPRYLPCFGFFTERTKQIFERQPDLKNF
jgi:hypothetical protein